MVGAGVRGRVLDLQERVGLQNVGIWNYSLVGTIPDMEMIR